jgi:hypothetical protein
MRSEVMRLGLLTAALALGQDSGLQALSQGSRQLVEFMLAIDFDRFARGIQSDNAVLALAQMQLEIRAQGGRHGVIDQIVEFGEKFRAGH